MRIQYFGISFLSAFVFLVPSISPDTIKLKNGQTYENVKTEISSDTVSFVFEGKLKEFSKLKVLSVRLKPVYDITEVSKSVSKPKAPSNIEQGFERIRIAESLMNQFDWEAEIGEKPKLAVLNFQAGEGVSKGELETSVEMIVTTLVKTNLFTIIDSQTIARVKSEQERYNEDCKLGKKDCTSKLGELLSANRILTGKITKINATYYVNGSIIDPVNNRIDFAESESAEKAEKLPKASESFAKKIAGGILEYAEVTYATTTKIPNLMYLKKSALFPGYGQYAYAHDKNSSLQKYKGIAWGVLTFALLTQTWLSYQDFQTEKSNYQTSKAILFLSANSQFDILALHNEQDSFDRLQSSANANKASVASLGFVYLLGLLDTYFLPLSSFTKGQSNSSVRFSTSHSSNSIGSFQREQIYTLEYIGRF